MGKGEINIVVSRRVVLETGIVSAGIVISPDGTIADIITGPRLESLQKNEKVAVVDYGDAVILAGLVDSHVHVNEPGRTDWEGFRTATQAAAAGGVTTIVDMPLNSIPPTTTLANFQTKLKSAEGQIFVDTAFWGGLVPTNHDSLVPLVNAGVVGFKCFLCPSGVEEFPHVDENDVRKALSLLKETDSLLAFHAELDCPDTKRRTSGDPSQYKTFLKSRPAAMETQAVDMVCSLCAQYSVRCHIVHASASEVVEKAKKARACGAPLSVETCHHYLTLDADHVPDGDTFYKCCPPIRDQVNQDELWRYVRSGDIQLIVSDHSPCPPHMKTAGDFMAAWGGISSLQFGLSVIWTWGAARGMDLPMISRLLSWGPAQLCRLSNKGSISIGKDADLVVFDPDEEFTLDQQSVLHRHKLSPHIGRPLRGRILLTILRGDIIYRPEQKFSTPKGKIILVK